MAQEQVLGHLVAPLAEEPASSGKTMRSSSSILEGSPIPTIRVLPSYNGNARSVARIQSVVACGGEVDGDRLLSPKTIDHIFAEQANGVDLVLGLPLRFGIGYGLPQLQTLPYIPDGRICFWGVGRIDDRG